MPDTTIDNIPLGFLQAAYHTLCEVEAHLEATIEGSDNDRLTNEVGNLISYLNVMFLDRDCHPDKKLIEAGFYEHLLPKDHPLL